MARISTGEVQGGGQLGSFRRLDSERRVKQKSNKDNKSQNYFSPLEEAERYIYIFSIYMRSLWYWNRIGVITMNPWLLCTDIEYICKCGYMFMYISYL